MLNLTRQERSVLLFLTALTLFGLGINFSLKKFPGMNNLYQRHIWSIDRINLNRATYQDLVGLPDIGPVLADRIINYRHARGGFKDMDELRNINGVGLKKFNRIKRYFLIDKNS